MNNGQKSLSINETFIIEGLEGDVLSACTGFYTNALISCTGNTQILLSNNIIKANSAFSATTFYGDGSNLTGISTQDTFVTGGTYNSNSGIATFTNNTGGTFSVNGFYTGSTDIYITGVTFSNNLLSLYRNDGVILGANINSFTSLTVNGSVSATTFYGDGSNLTGISTQDTFVTGGTYSDGTALFTNNTGGTFNVSGFYTGATDVFVTGATKSNNVATFVNNTGGTFTLTGLTDTIFTGGTVAGSTIFTNGLTANTFALSTTPNTNTTDTDVLVRNQSTGIIEQRSINSLTNVVNLVTVGLSGSTGVDYYSVKEAVDSITGSSSNNRFLVSVGPGRFSEGEIDLSQKPYISIKGSDLLTTEIVPNTNTQHIFKIGQNNELSFLSLSGAPSGYAGIYVYDTGIYSLAHKLSFIDCDTNVWVESHTQYTSFYGEYLDFNGEYSYGTKTIAYNGYVALTTIENYYNFPTGTGTTIGNHVQGSGATLSVFVGDGIGNGASGSTNYQISDYASLNTMSTTCYNWGYAVRVLNNGGPSRFDIDSLSIVDSLVWDLSIEHPNTFGTFGGGSSSHAKINNLSNDVYWAFLDIEDGEFDITRKISITFQDDTHTDTSTLIFEGSTMGLIDGGVITHVSGLTFEVSSGFGYLKKTIGNGIYMRIDWLPTQITLLPDDEVYLYFNENEILSSSGSAPDSINNIILGRVVTDSSTVRFIDSSPYIGTHTSNLFSNFNRSALGPIYSTGSIVTENVTPYHLNISSGDYYYSENNFKPSGGTDVSFVQYYRDNLTGWTTTGTTEVVNGYDDNSGTISPLPLSSFTKHSLYVVGEGVNETYMLVLGQTTYSTLVEAEGADLPTPPTYFDDSVTPIASILIQQGMSGITEIQDIRPVIGFKAAGVSASAVHANLLGLSADDHTQYLLVDGDRAMSGNLSMGGNAIFSALTYNGVTIESHASRHKNGGADEIASATPAPSEIPKADTFGKLDGWISDASSSVKGLTNLSVNPLVSNTPIAVGVNDPRFLNSITAVTNTTPSLVFTNNSGGTTTISNLRISGVSATTISATTYQNLPLGSVATSGSTLYSTSPSTSNFNTSSSIFLGSSAGNGATSATFSNFLGFLAGTDATSANRSNFLGAYAGNSATNANRSNFFGPNAGLNATNAQYSNFFGNGAGASSSNAQYSNFFGDGAGGNANNASGSTFMGQSAGNGATSASYSNFLGQSAGSSAFFGSFSNLFGYQVGSNTTGLSVNSIGSNNIIIGTNITLSGGTTNSINLGGVLFGTGAYSLTAGTPSFSAQTNGRIGIGIVTPTETLHVSGNTRIQGGLSATTISATTYQNLPIDIRVTGATYSASTGITTFRNNTGGTFTVTGYFTPSNDIYVSGGTVDHGPSDNADNLLLLNRSDLTNVTISNLVNISNTTKSDIDSLIGNKWLIRGKTYKISGCDSGLYDNGTDGRGDPVYTSIYLMGLEGNRLSETGIGEFYTPKYSDFSIFVDNNSYTQDQEVIWGGYVWNCIQFGTYTSIDIFTLDPNGFEIIYPFESSDSYRTRLYNIQYDDIIYDYTNDKIIYRNEQNSNIVSTTYENIDYWENDMSLYNPIKAFQWGNLFTDDDRGIGNQTIVNSYNENINYTGRYQINLHFENNSYQKNITSDVDEGNYQDGIILENYSYIDTISLRRGPSYQSNIKLSNNSYISNIILDRLAYQNEIILDNNSYIDDIDMSSAQEAYQSRIFLSNNSYIKNGSLSTFSYQTNFVFNNGSYMDTFDLAGDCSQQNFNFNNLSYQSGCTLVVGVDQEFIYMDNGSQSNGFSESQTNITVKGYDIDWSSYPPISPQTDLYFIHNLVNDDTAPVYIGKINNRLVEVTKPIDIFVTGGTYNSGTNTATFTNNSGGTFNVTGFTSGGGGSFTGGTVSGATTFTGGLTANTISATTITSPSISTYGLIVATSIGYQNIF